MKYTFNFFLVLVLTIVLLSACSDTKNKTDSDAKNSTDLIDTDLKEITWEDLMPEGEDAVLEQLYTDYYAALEEKARSTTLEPEPNGDAVDGTNGTDDQSAFDINSIAEGAENDTMEQIGSFNVVKALNGQKVRIPGYIVPLDFNANSAYIEFLLVPYFGACLHTPPPPPNQIIYVKIDENTPAKVESIYDPVWIEGVLTTGEFSSDLANTAYELNLTNIENYE